MHRADYVHCDIKENNLYVAGSTGLVGDLGTAVRSGQPVRADTDGEKRTIGTLGYMPPEQMCGLPMTPAADVFSLGVTAVQALTDSFPWPAITYEDDGQITQSLEEIHQIILLGNLQETVPSYVPIETQGLLYWCLEPDPANRPAMSDLAELPFS